eukprot:scaffold19337_cov89-Skeletonema_dohrnii-CCMP3373.AAC.2
MFITRMDGNFIYAVTRLGSSWIDQNVSTVPGDGEELPACSKSVPLSCKRSKILQENPKCLVSRHSTRLNNALNALIRKNKKHLACMQVASTTAQGDNDCSS